MIGTIILFIVSILIGLGILIGYNRIIPRQANSPLTLSPSPTLTTLAFEYDIKKAPPRSIKASITTSSGEMLWESRSATEPAQLTENITIQQGESIGTGPDGEIDLSLGEHVQIIVANDSLISLTQTLPESIVLTHQKGTVTYTLSSNDQPTSIRVGRLLVRLEKGSLTIEIDEDTDTILVESTEGKAHIAYNDADFDTQYINLSQKETFIYDRASRRGEIQ